MPKTEIDGTIARRAAREVEMAAIRQDCGICALLDRAGINSTTFYWWRDGKSAPNAASLLRLHEAGLDVIYILTGERKAASDVAASEAASKD